MRNISWLEYLVSFFLALFNWPRPQETVVVFTRFPEAGSTKTRLIPQLGEQDAAALQRAMTEHIVRVVRRYAAVDSRRHCCVEVHFKGGSEEQMREWLGLDLTYIEQQGSDLGEGLQNSFAHVLARRRGPVLIVGSDIPGIEPQILRMAFDCVQTVDAVIGPATDGGYYLIGAKKLYPPLFHNIDWGTEKVLAQSVNIASRHKIALTTALPQLSDIDNYEDIKTWTRVHAAELDRQRQVRVSVIIPTFNEENNLARTIQQLHASGDVNTEILVCDGGSTDRTVRVAHSLGARVIECQKGRGRQLFTGANAATGQLLVFLHSDTRLPGDFLGIVRHALQSPELFLGAFGFAIYDEAETRLRGLDFIERMTNWRCKYRLLPFGDQALFMTVEHYRQVGGIDPACPLMEDVALVMAVRRAHRAVVTLNTPVYTSARRWRKKGVLLTTLLNNVLLQAYFLGVSPRTIFRVYYGVPPPV